MTIAFDGRVLQHRSFSGVENYAASLVDVLGSKPEFALLKPRGSNRYLQQFWEHLVLPFAAMRHDILFCPANIAPLWVPRRTKLVMTLHDTAFLDFPESFSGMFAAYYRCVVPRNIRRANTIITISEASKALILRHYPEAEGKIAVLPLGINPLFRADPYVGKERQVLYVGSMNERKNVAGVIEAFEALPESLGYTLAIVGEFFKNFTLSERTKQALERARSNKRIVFKGALGNDALLQQYRISECLLYPSFYEGFGLPPLEAMACGTPVIVSNVSSMPEVCADAALYVDPYDAASMAKQLERLLTDRVLRQTQIEKGLARAKTYTWKRSATAHMDILEKAFSL